jgi:adenylate cyclase class 2
MRQSDLATAGREIEVKIPLPGVDGMADRLQSAGFVVSAARVFEANTLYDSVDQRLRSKRQILRLRQVDSRVVLTWKGGGEDGPYKIREEWETGVDSFSNMQTILERLGFAPSFRYEKFRTEFRREADEEGVVTLDETPIGTFLELEGPAKWIDQTAELLGFSQANYVLESYGRLYLAHCARHGLQPANMVFASK